MRGLKVDRNKQLRLSRTPSTTVDLTNLVNKHIGEMNTFDVSDVVKYPSLVIVKVNIAVESAGLLVVRVEGVSENVGRISS